MTRLGNVLAVAVVLAALAACSSDEAAPATTDVIPTVVESTSAPTAPSTSTTTTVAPTTTTDPATTLAAEVEADFLEADRLAREASQDPFNETKAAAAFEHRTGFALESFRAKLAGYRANNYAIRASSEVASSLTIEVPASVSDRGADPAASQVQVCEIDSWVLVEVGAGPNGSDAVVDPNVLAYRSTVFLREIGGVWKIEGGNEIARWEGLDSCPAE